MDRPPCTNPVCEQYRIQHKNMTIRKQELEKELRLIQQNQVDEFNQTITTRLTTPVRDAATGEMGLQMPNGEIMTPNKLCKRMEMAAACHASLQASEKVNRQLTEENQRLKEAHESVRAEVCRLARILSGFERSRRYETFTDEAHRETLTLNERLAEQVEHLERRIHVLSEENEIFKQRHRRENATASRIQIDDEEQNTAAAYVTSDGRVPPSCPYGPCQQYEAQVVLSDNSAEAFTAHMTKHHKV